MTFRIDPHARAEARRLLASTTLEERLYGAGWLVAMGAADEVEDVVARSLEGVLEAVDTAPIADDALALAVFLDEHTSGHEEEDVAFGERVESLLRTRTRFELQRLAAERLAATGELTSSQADDVDYFEEVVRSQLWRLVGANEHRALAHDSFAPPLRPRFWWLHEGIGIPQHAVRDLPAVAMLVARFPEAERELSALTRTRDLLLVGDVSSAKVVSLGAWLQRRTTPSTEHRVRVAAADGRPARRSLVETDRYVISLYGLSELVVDVLDEVEEAPVLERLDGSQLSPSHDPADPGRYTFILGDDLRAEARVVLRIPNASGSDTVPLPPES